MRYGFALLAVVSTCSILPANSQECDPEISLASLTRRLHGGIGSTPCGSDRSLASVKEGEFETSETIAAIERNREDRERTVVIDR